MNFIHAADIHLGYRQYDLDERFRDFGNSFLEIVKYAIASGSDFVLISGDLFHNRNINAPTYTQAHHVLTLLKDAGIPCIAIEGNHDRPFLKDGMSWLDTLEAQGLLKLIKPGADDIMCNYIDIAGTRIFGLCYAGSSTSSLIPRIAEEIKFINSANRPQYTILMMHLGVEGNMKGKIIGEVTYEELAALKGSVDYLALGHYHNRYEVDGWVYNPGSPDTCSVSEVSGDKGFYHVKDGVPELRSVDPRKFIMININVDDHLSADSLLKELQSRLDKEDVTEKQPIVNVIFQGCLNFSKTHIDQDIIKEMVASKHNPLYTSIKFDLTNDEFCISDLETEGIDRSLIEREVLRRLAISDSMLSPFCDLFASSVSEIKDMAAKGADGESIDRSLRKTFDEIKNGKPVSIERKSKRESTLEKAEVMDIPTLPEEIEEEQGGIWDWRKKA
ncbi:DNA repair exonuclease [Methanocella sp. CWC-04]|uniref:DNA repair exonuclease n=1 Tax=Methanooceanicella nereidis TaxID=2052831 RepID=A0AAP2W7H8_9EURY|nr:DNA repair exonuclease [Methanocella sp. CWC-04]MCD1295214.1 DNA repair exonuclease [Methanocella sp. CWC-04]